MTPILFHQLKFFNSNSPFSRPNSYRILRTYLLQLLLQQKLQLLQSYQPLGCYLFVIQMFYCVFLCSIMTRNAMFSRLTRNNTCLIMLMFDHVCYTMFFSHVDEMWTRPSVKRNPNPIVCYFHTIMYCFILLITPANTYSQIKSPIILSKLFLHL